MERRKGSWQSRTLGKHVAKRLGASDALQSFLDAKAKKNRPRTVQETTWLLKKHFKVLWKKDLDDITNDDVVRITDRLMKDGSPSAANHATTAIKTFFRWCVTQRHYLSHSPLEGMLLPAKAFMCFASSQDPSKRAKGKDVVALAAHIRKCGQRDAAQWLLDSTGTTTTTKAPAEEKGLKPLDHIQPEHERTQQIIDAETAIVLGVGFTNKGPMRDTVAVPCYDPAGVRLAYLGILEDGTYRFYPGFPHLTHLFNAHQVVDREVQLVPTVQDVLQQHEQGNANAVCFLTLTVSDDQLRVLATWLKGNDRVLVI